MLCGSAITDVGVDRLADYLVEIGPPAVDRTATVKAGGTDVEVKCDPDGDPLAVVFHTIDDPYVGHLSLFRVLSGQRSRSTTTSPTRRTGADLRLHGLFTLRGKEHVDVDAFGAGDIGVGGQAERHQDRRRARPEGQAGHDRPAAAAPSAVAAVALLPRTQSDDDKLGPALNRLREEDPTLLVERNTAGQLLLAASATSSSRWPSTGCSAASASRVDTEPVRVAYRETITGTAEAEGRHKKQTGGHGQFAVCMLRVEPLEQGDGLPVRRRRSSAGPSRRATSRPWRRASRRPWPRAACTASPSST